jgi:hypothetical protein
MSRDFACRSVAGDLLLQLANGLSLYIHSFSHVISRVYSCVARGDERTVFEPKKLPQVRDLNKSTEARAHDHTT